MYWDLWGSLCLMTIHWDSEITEMTYNGNDQFEYIFHKFLFQSWEDDQTDSAVTDDDLIENDLPSKRVSLRFIGLISTG